MTESTRIGGDNKSDAKMEVYSFYTSIIKE